MSICDHAVIRPLYRYKLISQAARATAGPDSLVLAGTLLLNAPDSASLGQRPSSKAPDAPSQPQASTQPASATLPKGPDLQPIGSGTPVPTEAQVSVPALQQPANAPSGATIHPFRCHIAAEICLT